MAQASDIPEVPSHDVSSTGTEKPPVLPSALRLSSTEALSQDSLATQVASLPLWQRRYLAALQGNLSTIEALKRANVTQATISDWTTPGARRYDPVFARAESLVASGVALLDVGATRDLAIAYAASMIEDAVEESRDSSVRPSDRVANRRLVTDAAGVTGRSPQVNIGTFMSKALFLSGNAPPDAPSSPGAPGSKE